MNTRLLRLALRMRHAGGPGIKPWTSLHYRLDDGHRLSFAGPNRWHLHSTIGRRWFTVRVTRSEARELLASLVEAA